MNQTKDRLHNFHSNIEIIQANSLFSPLPLPPPPKKKPSAGV